MTRPILPRLLSRAADVLTAAIFGLDADREATRGLAEHAANLARHLAEARRIAHEQEDAAAMWRDRAEAAKVLVDHIGSVAIRDRQWAGRWKEAAKGFRLGRLAAIRRGDASSAVANRWHLSAIETAKALAVERAKAPSAADVAEARRWAETLPPNAAALLMRLARVEDP